MLKYILIGAVWLFVLGFGITITSLNERKINVMSVKHRGITAYQSNIDYHIMLFTENGERVMHCSCNKPMTENELKSVIDNYYHLTENFDKIYEDNENEE